MIYEIFIEYLSIQVYLLVQLGFDGLFLGRIDYADKIR
jgi:hypothetical protein